MQFDILHYTQIMVFIQLSPRAVHGMNCATNYLHTIQIVLFQEKNSTLAHASHPYELHTLTFMTSSALAVSGG